MKNPKRRLILHVGQTKAGSTAIQNYLESQRDKLHKHGILFPKAGFSRGNPVVPERTAGHLNLVKMIFQNGSDPALAELQGTDTVLISAENLFMDRPDAELQALAAFFEDYAVTLVLVLRSWEAWFSSRYIENVMSGFIASTRSFSESHADYVQRGTHDYAARLEHLGSLLNASELQVVNYDSAMAGAGVVPAFLAAADIPVTDPVLANSIRANVREKDAFLVEGKRRLNHVIQALPSVTRLSFEASLRKQAHALSKSLPSPADPWRMKVPLTPSTRQEVQASNRKLVERYGLSPAFPEPEAHPDRKYQHRCSWPEIDTLTVSGLKLAAELYQDRAAQGSSNASLLSTAGAAILIDHLVQATLSLHLDSPETALWAACLNGKLPILLSDRHPLPDCARLLSVRLPSDIVCLDSGVSPRTILRKRQVDLVVVPPGASLERVCDIWRLAGSRARVIVMDPDHGLADAIAESLDLVCMDLAGHIRMLGPPDGSHIGRLT